jgi:uncharacterized protein YfaS (alpha-2-macroglobulin family)
MRLTNTSETTLFVGVTTRGTPPPGAEQASARGLRLSVDYQDPDGRAVDVSSLESGTDFVATIEVTNRSGSRWENLALTQILPSGWEILNTRLDQPEDGAAPVAPESEVDYEDIRDDRLHRYFALDDGETKRFVTVLNAAYSGRFYQPGVSVEAMYDARTQARIEGQWVVVEDPAR